MPSCGTTSLVLTIPMARALPLDVPDLGSMGCTVLFTFDRTLGHNFEATGAQDSADWVARSTLASGGGGRSDKRFSERPQRLKISGAGRCRRGGVIPWAIPVLRTPASDGRLRR